MAGDEAGEAGAALAVGYGVYRTGGTAWEVANPTGQRHRWGEVAGLTVGSALAGVLDIGDKRKEGADHSDPES